MTNDTNTNIFICRETTATTASRRNSPSMLIRPKEMMDSLQILISILICSTLVKCQRDMQYDSILTMYNPETDDYKPRKVINLATTSGPIYGFTEPTSQNGIGVNCYLGVPYAVPPVGYRRFRVSCLQACQAIPEKIKPVFANPFPGS
jgi:hypothetical protein